MQGSTEPTPSGAAGGVGTAIRSSGLRVLALAFVALGSVFGSIEVVTLAFTDERGAPAAAGPVLALLATGSLIAGLAYGALHLAAPLHRQFLVTVSAFGVLVCTLPLASSIPVLSGLALGTGLAVAPTLIAGFALVERLVPAASLTEGLAWISTGIGFGLAIGSSAGGWAVEAAGAQAAYVVTAGSGLAAAALTWAGRRQLRAGRQRSPGERLGLGDELPVSRGGDSASRSAGRTAP